MILTCKLNPKHCAKQKKPKIKNIYIKSGDGREESLLPGQEMLSTTSLTSRLRT